MSKIIVIITISKTLPDTIDSPKKYIHDDTPNIIVRIAANFSPSDNSTLPFGLVPCLDLFSLISQMALSISSDSSMDIIPPVLPLACDFSVPLFLLSSSSFLRSFSFFSLSRLFPVRDSNLLIASFIGPMSSSFPYSSSPTRHRARSPSIGPRQVRGIRR